MYLKICRRIIPAVLALLLVIGLWSCGRSAPDNAPGSVPDSVIYMSDTQSDSQSIYDYSDFGALLCSARETAPEADALIIGGDLVNKQDDPAEWDAFFAAGGTALESLTVYPAAGNHTDSADIFTEKFHSPSNGPAGHEYSFYSFDHGAIHFVVLDSLVMGSAEPEVVDTVSRWLEADLKSAETSWTVAVMHHPMYPFSGNAKNEVRGENMRTYYLPLLENGGVDILLCGHEHMYCRTVPLTGGTAAEAGLVQIMSVSGGKHYDFPESSLMAFALPDTSVYTVITGTPDTLIFDTYTAGSTLVDTYALSGAESE